MLNKQWKKKILIGILSISEETFWPPEMPDTKSHFDRVAHGLPRRRSSPRRKASIRYYHLLLKGRYLQFVYLDRSNRAFSHALSIVFNGDTPKHELANSSLRIDILTCKLKTRGAFVRPTSKIYAQFIMNL